MESGTQTAALLARIETLEQRYRRFRLASAVAVVAVGCCLLTGADDAKPTTVEADRFVLRDKAGKARAALEMGATGPRLVLKNDEETDRATLGFTTDGNPVLSLMNEQGTERAILQVKQDGFPLLVLSGDDNRRLIAGVSETDQGVFWFDRGSERIGISSNKDGDGVIIFRDPAKKLRTLISGYGGDSGLMVFGPTGKIRLSAILENGEPRISFNDAEGKPLFVLPPTQSKTDTKKTDPTETGDDEKKDVPKKDEEKKDEESKDEEKKEGEPKDDSKT